MARYFNEKEIELLAPAGTFEIFQTIVEANCDAIYFGGPVLNMRLMRKGYNLTHEELEQAIQIAHDRGKRVYITVNNLFDEADVEEAKTYLRFLDSIRPDGLIVQDMAIFPLIQEQKLTVPLHSSVMMNVHNLEMIEALKTLGVTRVVASREMDLQTAKQLQALTNMEFEYFVHGDMCTVHGANCLYSSMLFGNSSNRGRCMKPCRWDYRVKKDGYVYPTEYPLAAKDMYMYEHIPELIESGITSFKIEGRMRDKEFLVTLINSYGDAIDRYIDDPIGFDRCKDKQSLFENRKRDFSTGYAFGKPGLDYINRRYEGTGKFYSTGKVFSTTTEEREIREQRIDALQEAFKAYHNPAKAKGELCVRVNNQEQAEIAIAEGVEHIYLAGDVFLPDLPFTKNQIKQLVAKKGTSKIYLGMPRMMFGLQFDQYNQFVANLDVELDGLVVTNIGAMHKFKPYGLPMVSDLSLNLYNHKAVELYQQFGMTRAFASVELKQKNLVEFVQQSPLPTEVLVHGSPVVMYLEHDLYENTREMEPIAEEDNKYVDNKYLVLLTDKGENPVYCDQFGRNHLTTAKELCLLPVINDLLAVGVSHFRIEGATYTTEQLRTIIRLYQEALQHPERSMELYEKTTPIYAGYTLGTLSFD
ncbi:U32 family peptidase [Brevibacillus laterosporus]|uniref:U32 family peptidase n=1 Tax=Brevibacillus laterosporus TaxID=1465 RepID=A0A518V7C3_BRELA|nr:U32 family peptidase [Brevibacillus laterosporus]QDX92911.1 U32 family peptidase [Brevibacillus laterosporus]TPG71266.1 U32 family peptidase [Brevibacillus laterosporus]